MCIKKLRIITDHIEHICQLKIELKNVQKLKHMFIPNPHTHIFIPYGYRSIGKSMIIIRLIRYLFTNGYMVRPNLVFKDETDELYHSLCQRYMDQIYSTHALAVTGVNDTILLEVMDCKGKSICYIVDQAGEHHYDINNPQKEISDELYNIIHSQNPKIWGFIIENNRWLYSQERQGYVQNIRKIASCALPSKDKVLFIYNKIDQTQFVIGNGKVLLKDLFDSAESLYPEIFVPFERRNALFRILMGKYCFRMVPFQSGFFYESRDYTYFYEGKDEYPKQLWNNILKCLR